MLQASTGGVAAQGQVTRASVPAGWVAALLRRVTQEVCGPGLASSRRSHRTRWLVCCAILPAAAALVALTLCCSQRLWQICDTLDMSAQAGQMGGWCHSVGARLVLTARA